MQVIPFSLCHKQAVQALGLSHATHVLEKDGTIIGAAAVRDGVCRDFCVHPAFRRKGYGTYFLKQLLRLGAGQPFCVCAPLATPPEAAHTLCTKLGLVPGAGPAPGVAAQSGQVLYHRPVPLPRMDALAVAHTFLRTLVKPGGTAVDATAGNGHDTLFLAQLVGSTGSVTALDIQPQAVEHTNALLRREGCSAWAQAVCDSHENIARYAAAGTLSAAVFNLGYLPGGSHAVFTQPHTSIPAMQTALALLCRGGVLTACLYSGGAQGTAERDAALAFFRALPPQKYSVMVCEFPHRATAAVPVCVIKLEA